MRFFTNLRIKYALWKRINKPSKKRTTSPNWIHGLADKPFWVPLLAVAIVGLFIDIIILVLSITEKFRSDFDIGSYKLVLLVLFTILIIMSWLGLKICIKEGFISKKSFLAKLDNIYLVITLTVFIFALVISFAFYNGYLQYNLPIKDYEFPLTNPGVAIVEESMIDKPFVTCIDEDLYKRFIINNTLVCTYNFKSNNNTEWRLYSINVTYFYQNGSINSEEQSPPSGWDGLDLIVKTKVPPEKYRLAMQLYFVKNSSSNTPVEFGEVSLKSFEVYTLEQYTARRDKALTLLFTILSGLTLAASIILKNIKELIEK